MKPQTPFGQESSDIVKIYDEENKENSIPQKQENIQPDITTNECSVTILVTIKYKSANTAAQETSRHIECKDLILHIGHGT